MSVSQAQAPTEDAALFESIGTKILDMWDSNDTRAGGSSQAPLSYISKILKCDPKNLPKNWESEFKLCLMKLTPADFAIYGREISLFLVSMVKSQPIPALEQHISAHALPETSYPASEKSHHSRKPLTPRKYPLWLPTIEASDSD